MVGKTVHLSVPAGTPKDIEKDIDNWTSALDEAFEEATKALKTEEDPKTRAAWHQVRATAAGFALQFVK